MLCVVTGPTMANNNTNAVLQPEIASLTIENSFNFSTTGCTIDVEEYRVNCVLLGEAVAVFLKRHTDMPRSERRAAARTVRGICRFVKEILE